MTEGFAVGPVVRIAVGGTNVAWSNAWILRQHIARDIEVYNWMTGRTWVVISYEW